MSKSNIVVCEEAAILEFERFCEEMDIETDESVLDQEDLTAWNKQKRRIVGAIMKGALVVNENGEAVYTPQKIEWDGEPLTFREPTTADLMTMDNKKKSQDMKKTVGVIAAMTKTSAAKLSKIKGIDMKIMLALFLLLTD